MVKFISIGKAARLLGVSPQTMRRWEYEGRIVPDKRTRGGQRRYDPKKLQQCRNAKPEGLTLCYARVSSHDQKDDLERQRELLELYCASQGWQFEVLSDLGSGMNYHKKGLKSLLKKILVSEIERLVLTHKDRLLRFGAELLFSVCEEKGIEVVIINKGKQPSFEEELAQDVFEIITVFSARLYGARSKKNKKLLDVVKQTVELS